MNITFRPDGDRFYLTLDRGDGEGRTKPLGSLGSISAHEPLPASERIEFWAQFDPYWRDIVALHPDITREDADEIRTAIAERVPLSRTAHERKLLALAVARRNLIAAMAINDGGWALMDAAIALVRLMPDPKPRDPKEPEPEPAPALRLLETSAAEEPL